MATKFLPTFKDDRGNRFVIVASNVVFDSHDEATLWHLERAQGIAFAVKRECELLSVIYTDHMWRFEKLLHAKYAEFRLHSEWFELPQSAVDGLVAMERRQRRAA